MARLFNQKEIMPVFYTPPVLIKNDFLRLEGDEARHLARVMRLGLGDAAEVVDGIGNGFRTEIVAIDKAGVTCKILTRTRRAGEPDNFITLASGLSTGSKFDDIIQRGTELGVSRFIPLITEKSRIKALDSSAEKRRLDRWRKVAIASLKQSGRSVIPDIALPMEFPYLFERIENPGRLIMFDPSGELNLDSFQPSEEIANYMAIIGPESGFSPVELNLAREKEVAVFSLGKRILRTENAGPSIVAILMHILGEFR
jgi:16S rRNA (uracil1498-N3)-methyltransferase